MQVEASSEDGCIRAWGSADAGAGERLAGLLPVSNRIFRVEEAVEARRQDAPLLLWRTRWIEDQMKNPGSRDGDEDA